MSKSMKQRILTGVLLIAIAVPPLVIGGIPLRILIFSVAALASYEIIALRDCTSEWSMIIFLFISIVCMYNVPPQMYPAALAAFITILFLIMLFNKKWQIDDIAYIFIISTIITLALKGVIHIYEYSGLVMIYVAFACYFCDTGAYFFGSFFGKHKMIPRISPKKTWEGAIGGYLTGAFTSLLFGLTLCSQYLPTELIYTASFLLPAIAEIGDLFFSSIKRHYGVKDFGSIFPGHGGVLDRIDSLVFCLMAFNALLLLWRI